MSEARGYTVFIVQPIVTDGTESTAPDRVLVNRFLAGRREEDFRALYRAKTPRLMAFALRLCAGNIHDAEDIVQETWTRACISLPNFRWRSALSTWLCGIAVNCYRESRRHAVTVPLDSEEPIPAPPANAQGFEDLVLRLPDRCREVIVLHDIHGYTHPEVAAMLQIAEGTSRYHLSRARKILSAWLSPLARTEK